MPPLVSRHKLPELVSPRDAAELCGVHQRTIRRWIAQGYLPATRLGPKALRIRATDLLNFVNNPQ